jgi:ABC-type lipoprotein export system ATPase subunit
MMLRVEHLGHTYPIPGGNQAGRLVLELPMWQVEAGQQILLRGISGSGKTTLFNILAGLLWPTTGQVWLDDQNLYALPEADRDRFRAERIGYVFQNHYLLTGLTALENVMMPMMFAKRITAKQRQTRARDLLAQLGIDEFWRYLPRQLSTGQRLRVAVARALVNTPQLLLADEPTAALDFDAARTVMDILQQTCAAQETILIVASHDPALSERFTNVIHLSAGQFETQEGRTA